jgi:hypothetical protein
VSEIRWDAYFLLGTFMFFIIRVFIVFPSLFSIVLVSAQMGSKEDAIDAANRNEEPAYIKDFAEKMTQKLYEAAQKKDCDPLVWLLRMHAIVTAAMDATRNAVEDVVGDAARMAGKNASLKAAWSSAYNAIATSIYSAAINTDWYVAEDASLDRTKNTVWDAARMVAGDVTREAAMDADMNVEKIRRIAWRVAEWAVLDYLIKNVGKIIEETDKSIIIRSKNNPFNMSGFFQLYFENLSVEAMLFLAPWLLQMKLPIDGVSALHQPLFSKLKIAARWYQIRLFMLWVREKKSAFNTLPPDIISLILSSLIIID